MSDCHLGRIRAEWLVAFIVGAWFMSGVNVANGSVSENVQKDSAIHRPEVPGTFRDPASHSMQGHAATASTSEGSDSSFTWEVRPSRSYLIPALEIPVYPLLLSQYDRHFTAPKDDYRTTANTFWTHVTDSKWVHDNDQFSVNQFLHPYGGTVYFGLARSAAPNFWESWLYTEAGSLLWELGGEKTCHSINDQITTTFGGTFLGEPLFRPTCYWRVMTRASQASCGNSPRESSHRRPHSTASSSAIGLTKCIPVTHRPPLCVSRSAAP